MGQPDAETIIVQLRPGLPPQTVEVLERVGALVLHATLYRRRPARPWPFTVTHPPTGLAICFSLTQEHARQAAQALESLDWAFSTAEAMPTATETAGLRIIRRLIREKICVGGVARRRARGAATAAG